MYHFFSEHRVHYCRPMSQFAPPTSWSVITLAAGRVYSTKNKASVWCLSVCLSVKDLSNDLSESCSRDTSAPSALGLLNDNVLYKDHALSHSLITDLSRTANFSQFSRVVRGIFLA